MNKEIKDIAMGAMAVMATAFMCYFLMYILA